VGTSVGSTASFVLLTVVTVIWVDQLEAVYLAASFAAFLAGIGLFAVVLLLAAARSRSDAMGIGGLFFLIDCAPRNAFRAMNGSLAAAVVVSVVGAVLRSRTAVIFGTLEPMLPLALSGLWSVRHGHFPPRVDEREPQRGQKKVPGAAGPEDQTPEPQTSEDGPEPS
jgi:hypothetical protein